MCPAIPVLAANKLMSGTLLSIGTLFSKYKNKRDLGTFVKKMVKMGRADSHVAGYLYYYVGEGAAAGSGRLSRGMALCAKQWVQSVLRGRVDLANGQSVKINRLSRYIGPAIQLSRSPQYQDWINETPFFKVKDTVSYLTGAMAAAIIATPSASGGYRIKVDARRWARPSVPFSYPLRFAKRRIPIAAYAMWQEKGVQNLYPARPWISGAMVAWVQSFDETWGKLLEEQLTEVFWDTFDTDIASDTKFVSLDSGTEQFNLHVDAPVALESAAYTIRKSAEFLASEVNSLENAGKGAISNAIKNYITSNKIKGMSSKRIIARLIASGLTRMEAESIAKEILRQGGGGTIK